MGQVGLDSMLGSCKFIQLRVNYLAKNWMDVSLRKGRLLQCYRRGLNNFGPWGLVLRKFVAPNGSENISKIVPVQR